MGNFNKEIYMKGCRLRTKLTDDLPNMYQFIFNSEKGDFSEIYDCSDGMEYELEDDGTYYVVTIQNANATLSDGKLTIGSRTWSAEELQENIQSANQIINIGLYDLDEVLSICKLKKCLADLELRMFQEQLKNCGSIKCKNSELKGQRDFMFIAVWLIENYIDLGNIEKARSIYDRLQSCGSLCETLASDTKNCGCNG